MQRGPDASWTGQRLAGRYTVGAKLGMGGMGAVYAGTQDDLGRRVAIKMLHPHLAERHDLLARFKREALASAALGHPNIVLVTDFQHVAPEPPFLVMELLEGETLRDRLSRQGPLLATRMAFIADQVLSALEASHGAGIVHRDLKPENVFLTTISGMSDIVKVLDFGLAKHSTSQESALTATGAVMGTPAYMAPEQVSGQGVGPATDIYAVGAMMYHCLSGRLPFDGENNYALMYAIVDGPPAPSLAALRPDLDPMIVAAVERAMQRDSAHRFATATAMRQAIAPLLQNVATPAPPGQAHGISGAPTLPSGLSGSPVTPSQPPAAHHASGPSLAPAAIPHGVAFSSAPPNKGMGRALLALVAVIVLLLAVIAGGVWWAASRGSSDTLAATELAAKADADADADAQAEPEPEAPETTPESEPEPEPETQPTPVVAEAETPAAGEGEGGVGILGQFLGGDQGEAKPEPEPETEDAEPEPEPEESAPVDPPQKKKKKKKKVEKREATGGVKPYRSSINARALLNLDVIKPQFASIKPQVTACYVKHEFSPGNHVYTNFHVFIDAQGNVTNVTPQGTRERCPDLDKCVFPLVRKLKFGPTKTGEGGKIDIGYTARRPGID